MTFKQSIQILAVTFLALFTATGALRAEPFRIVAFGDSLMAGFQLGPGESFPEKLEAALRDQGHDVVIANAGVSGDTTSGGMARLDWSVPDGTQLVILELGANDMLRGIEPAITEKNLSEMIESLRKRHIDVMLAGMVAAPNLGPEYAAEFNPIYGRLAEKYGLPLYPFFLEGVAGDTSLELSDHMHPNAAGVERMVENFLPVMEEALKGNENQAG